MSFVLKNTAFGDLLHLISRGKLVQSETQKRDLSELDSHFTRDAETNELIVDWYGENDPECPYNWPTWYKCWVTFLIFFMTMSVYMGSSVVSPSILAMANEFGVSQTTATLTMSLFVWGYGIGPLFLSPITEISWIGRNGPYIVGLGIFTILQIPTALVNNIAGMLVLRFLAGFFGSPVLGTGGASVGDMWRMDAGFPNALAFYAWGGCGGPALGPLLVSFAVEDLGWRWSFWPLLCLNGLNWILLFFALPETSSITILTRRAKQIRSLKGNLEYRSAGEISDRKLTAGELFSATLYRPFLLTVTEPVLMCTNLYISLVYGIMYCFFEAYPLTLQGNHGFSAGTLGVSYVSGFIACGLVLIFYCIYNNKVVLKRFREGAWKPEYRMEPAFVGGVIFPISMFWFGWTSYSSVHWISPVIAFGAFIISAFLLFQGLMAYLGENFPRYMASVFASNGLFRAMVGGAFPLFATQMFDKMTLQGGCSMLGGMALFLLPVIVIFYTYGAKLRSMSKNAGMGEAQEEEDIEKGEMPTSN
ncbi:hypothetical protein MPSI1_001552 [Malassezia psittaci]|uniref:Major facilitator superfamily (MFS) profile domain-containing protein n=1 Tax=Malassezia psittaci TaxID=1821823 RepID=A0AAF0F8Z8_9BASI|nr:hypothetical protein MPSI1_001552 [Malassezia psittaci]